MDLDTNEKLMVARETVKVAAVGTDFSWLGGPLPGPDEKTREGRPRHGPNSKLASLGRPWCWLGLGGV